MLEDFRERIDVVGERGGLMSRRSRFRYRLEFSFVLVIFRGVEVVFRVLFGYFVCCRFCFEVFFFYFFRLRRIWYRFFLSCDLLF